MLHQFLNPLITIRIIMRVPVQYAMTWVAVVGILLADALVSGVAGLILNRIPLLGGLGLNYLGVMIPSLAAFVMGRLIFQNAEDFGVLGEKQLVGPEWPEAQPRGVLQNLVPESAAQPIEVPPDPLREALEVRDDAGALAAFRELYSNNQAPMGLEAVLELRLASILERAGSHLEAAKACQRAIDSDPTGPYAAPAIFHGGRILIERAGRTDEGIAMYESLINLFPEDALAAKAKEELARVVR